MPDAKLVSFIQNMLRDGISLDVIKSQLKERKWPEKEINDAIQTAIPSERPIAKTEPRSKKVYCRSCGTENGSTSQNCKACGVNLNEIPNTESPKESSIRGTVYLILGIASILLSIAVLIATGITAPIVEMLGGYFMGFSVKMISFLGIVLSVIIMALGVFLLIKTKDFIIPFVMGGICIFAALLVKLILHPILLGMIRSSGSMGQGLSGMGMMSMFGQGEKLGASGMGKLFLMKFIILGVSGAVLVVIGILQKKE